MATERNSNSGGIRNHLNNNDPDHNEEVNWDEINEQYDEEGHPKFDDTPSPSFTDSKTKRNLLAVLVAVVLYWL